MFVEDLSAFLSDFGVLATLDGTEVRGIFDAEYAVSDVGIGISTTQPAFTLATVDVPSTVIDWFRYYQDPDQPVGAVLTVAGASYAIVAHEPDGTGMSRLLLRAAL